MTSLEEYGVVADIIIAVLTLCLGFYVFVYQRKKDKIALIESSKATLNNIKLQWFKELIVEPKIHEVFKFYEDLRSIKEEITTSDLDNEQKIDLINKIKLNQSIIRKSFLDLLQFISPSIFKILTKNLDNLTDHLTEVISNDELKLNNTVTFDREIYTKIQESYSDFMSTIFSFDGHS